MNTKIKELLFGAICIVLIFNNIPPKINMLFLGGPVGKKLVFYFLNMGFLYTAYCQYKYKNVLVNFDKFIKYIFAYLAVMLLSVVVGLYNYPYYDLVLNGPINQIEKLPKVIDLLNSFGIFIDSKLLLGAWVIVRQIKGVIVETFWCFSGAYMVYCWYKDDWQKVM